MLKYNHNGIAGSKLKLLTMKNINLIQITQPGIDWPPTGGREHQNFENNRVVPNTISGPGQNPVVFLYLALAE